MSTLVFLDPHYPSGRLANPSDPQILVNDLGVTRGEGVFETLLARDKVTRKLAAQLTRLQNSARMLDLTIPEPKVWEKAIQTALAAFDQHDAVVRLFASGGVEGTGKLTCWVHVSPVPEHLAQQRTQGVRVLLLERGYDATTAQRAPWLLLGAKSLSYAVNMAALRYARNHGAQDVIFHSSDGFVLEGPTSSVVIARQTEENLHLITPSPELGILPGTTQAAIFDRAEERGWNTSTASLAAEDLMSAAGVWLTSSIRGPIPVTHVDGQAIEYSPTLNEELGQCFDSIT